MATMYAWTDIKHADGVVKAGESVTAKKLGVDDDEWDQLCDSKAVRAAKFPDMPSDFLGSPLEFVQKQINDQLRVAEDAMSDDDAMLLATQNAEAMTEEPEDNE